MTVATKVAELARWTGWYLKEVAGEHDYDRYVEHHMRAHPDAPALSRREFERKRMDERQIRPGQRCC
ncbi:MAG: putative selenoprotein [Streptosporangiales bacterium]|nr:putative selenoprotein [Streptosporangiales bacterium]